MEGYCDGRGKKNNNNKKKRDGFNARYLKCYKNSFLVQTKKKSSILKSPNIVMSSLKLIDYKFWFIKTKLDVYLRNLKT